MDHRVPKTGAAISIALAICALITFLFLNSRFEGPDPTKLVRDPFQLTARFENTKKLPTKQPVLYKGISVGRVNAVEWDSEKKVAVVTFTMDGGFEVREDAAMQIGERSLLGDPYLNLTSRGSEGAPVLDSGDEIKRTTPSVDFDEALDFLDPEGRERVSSLIHTFAEGTSRPGNGERLNGTIGGTARTIRELRALTRELRGQEENIASLVRNSATVLETIGDREDSVRAIVGSGRATLDALASNTSSLDEAVAELPRVLDSGRRSLAAAEPLLREARPLVSELRALAPDLRFALEQRGPGSLEGLTGDLVRTVDGLTPLRERAVPVLTELDSLLENLKPLTLAIAPAARNLVPALGYLTPRVNGIAGLYALTAAGAENKDEVSNYLRAGFTFEPGEFSDVPTPAMCDAATQDSPSNAGYCANAYPGPNDALDPQPFDGTFPKLFPCDPPPRSKPTKPCS